MRGIILTTAVFFTVAITFVVAAPKSSTSTQWCKNKKVSGPEEGSSIFPSDRTRPSSPLPAARRKSEGPHLYFREPKALGREAVWDVNSGNGNSWQQGPSQGRNYPQQGYWPRYAFTQRGRDDDEDDDEDDEDAEDDIGDDSGSEEEDTVAFDTPSWDSIYPPSETGGYARQNEPSGPVSSWQKPVQQVSDGSYSLSAGSPGGPASSSYEGRSGYKNGPWAATWSPRNNWVQGPGSGSSSRRQVRRGPPPTPQWQWVGEEEVEGPSPWYGQGQGQISPSRWTNNVQPQPGPEYVRRSWNWRPSGPPRRPHIEQVDSDEDSGESGDVWHGQPQSQPQVWSGSSSGPRRVVRNWARSPTPTWGPRRSQKFGYY